MKRYKLQALMTSGSSGGGELAAVRAGRTQRMVVRGENHETHRCAFFSALVSYRGEDSAGLTGDRVLVTIELVGDEPRDCLDVGDHFSLWRGHDLGQGIVTRRLFV